jgi:membrane fusion protein (multidrug efflux system)
MKIKYIIYLVLIVGLTSLIIYRINENSKKAGGPGGKGSAGKPGTSIPPMRVSGIIVVPERFSNSLSVNGSIEANEQVAIRSQVSGLVNKIYFQEGSNVSAGQTLLKIDDAELRALLAQAITKQKLAAEMEQRAGLLLKKEAISQQEYDVALADLKSLSAQTQLIQAQLNKTTIKAPFSGKIGLRSISEGMYLSPETVIANLVNLNPVKITFSVPEKYSGQVKIDTEILFTVSGSTKKYKAKVYAIEPGIETATRTLQLRARAANPDGSLLPGSFANIELPLAIIDDAILIPTEAIIPIQNGKKVFVSQGGKAKEVMVETSTRTSKNILVTSGLTKGDTVLTTGVMSLKTGTPVKVSIDKK